MANKKNDNNGFEIIPTEHKVIAIVGRPNVGKSTLFNRMIGRRQAIVEQVPGATVDRHYGKAILYDYEYTVIDTGGLELYSDDELVLSIKQQSEIAMQEADIILMMLDGREPGNPEDAELIDILRKSERPVYYLVNKIDGPKHESNAVDFYTLGMDPLYFISAEHGLVVDDVMAQIEQDHPSAPQQEKPHDNICRIAVVGRPNAGKSSLVNKALGSERLAVTDIPGTTRDAIDTLVEYEDKQYLFIDTAGIRRKKKITEELEKATVIKAFKALDRADVALLLLDATLPLAEQDKRIAGMIDQKGRSCVVVVNKWDVIEEREEAAKQKAEEIRDGLKFMPHVPIIFLSAKTGRKVVHIFDRIDNVFEEGKKRIQTSELNRWLEETTLINRPPAHKGRLLKVYYIAQVEVLPPTFVLSINDPDLCHFSYQRYLINRLREVFGFEGAPIKMWLKRRGKERKEMFEKKKDDPKAKRSGSHGSGSKGLSSKGTSTNGPSSQGPSSQGPSSKGPGSKGPGTKGPSSKGPGTKGPGSKGPSTKGPSTKGPGSKGPSTKRPSSKGPNTKGPSTKRPSSKGPNTKGPSTKRPSSKGPSSKGLGAKGSSTKRPSSKAPSTKGPRSKASGSTRRK